VDIFCESKVEVEKKTWKGDRDDKTVAARDLDRIYGAHFGDCGVGVLGIDKKVRNLKVY